MKCRLTHALGVMNTLELMEKIYWWTIWDVQHLGPPPTPSVAGVVNNVAEGVNDEKSVGHSDQQASK